MLFSSGLSVLVKICSNKNNLFISGINHNNNCLGFNSFPSLQNISNAHRTFSGIEHILGHKTSLSKLKKIEIILTSFLTSESMIPPTLFTVV